MDTDEALHERWAAGDLRAFERLYERFERPLFGFIRSQVRDPAEAEDLLHEAFMAVLRVRRRGGPPRELRSFRSWIFEVARNLCRNRARAGRRADRALAVEGAGAGAVPGARDDHRLEETERAAALERAVLRLPPALAELYRLRAAGMSYDEVATVLAIPVGTVKSRMHELVKRLRGEVCHDM
jgi:RNA polymerase sigma-70 factor (ECF subfamily)